MSLLPLIEQTLSQLKLCGMAREYARQSQSPQDREMIFDVRLSKLIESEINFKNNKRIDSLIKRASLRYVQASLEELVYVEGRNIQKLEIDQLATCNWIDHQHNILITGPTGTGKSWLACAFAKQACRRGFPVKYITAGSLYEAIALGQADGSLYKFKNSLSRMKLLVIDDFGLSQGLDDMAYTLLEILDRQFISGSVIITSQYPSNAWHGLFGDPTIADAILDRFIHNSYSIELEGESMRKRYALKKPE